MALDGAQPPRRFFPPKNWQREMLEKKHPINPRDRGGTRCWRCRGALPRMGMGRSLRRPAELCPFTPAAPRSPPGLRNYGALGAAASSAPSRGREIGLCSDRGGRCVRRVCGEWTASLLTYRRETGLLGSGNKYLISKDRFVACCSQHSQDFSVCLWFIPYDSINPG